MKQLHIAVVVVVAIVVAQNAHAQSLGALAKAEGDRRATTAAPPAKVISNKDLKAETVPTPTAAGAAPVATAAVLPISPSDSGALAASPLKTEAYWKDRMRALHAELASSLARAAAARAQLAGLQLYVSADGGMVPSVARSVFEARAELNQHIAASGHTSGLIAVLEEEGRRAGVPPGWLRIP